MTTVRHTPATSNQSSATTGFAVLDLETTGLAPSKGARIIEIGVVTVGLDGTVQDQWETLVDSGFGPGPTHIHGVDAAMLAGAPSFDEVVGDLARVLAGRTIVAHNASFDVGFLDAEFRESGVTWTRSALCTMQLARRRGRYPASLAACCDYYDIVNHGAHRALGDALATAELLGCLAAVDEEIPDGVAFPDGHPDPCGRVHLRPGA